MALNKGLIKLGVAGITVGPVVFTTKFDHPHALYSTVSILGGDLIQHTLVLKQKRVNSLEPDR